MLNIIQVSMTWLERLCSIKMHLVLSCTCLLDKIGTGFTMYVYCVYVLPSLVTLIQLFNKIIKFSLSSWSDNKALRVSNIITFNLMLQVQFGLSICCLTYLSNNNNGIIIISTLLRISKLHTQFILKFQADLKMFTTLKTDKLFFWQL